MFSWASVILFTGGGLSPGGSLSKEGGSLSKEGGSLFKGVSVQGGRHPRTVTIGQYALYWNAFLLFFIFY